MYPLPRYPMITPRSSSMVKLRTTKCPNSSVFERNPKVRKINSVPKTPMIILFGSMTLIKASGIFVIEIIISNLLIFIGHNLNWNFLIIMPTPNHIVLFCLEYATLFIIRIYIFFQHSFFTI